MKSIAERLVNSDAPGPVKSANGKSILRGFRIGSRLHPVCRQPLGVKTTMFKFKTKSLPSKLTRKRSNPVKSSPRDEDAPYTTSSRGEDLYPALTMRAAGSPGRIWKVAS